MASANDVDCQHIIKRLDCACCRKEVKAVTSRVTVDLSRRGFVAGMAASIGSLGLPDSVRAQTTTPSTTTGQPVLFTNVQLFDGVATNARRGMSILVQRDKIAAIVSGRMKAPDGAKVIDCNGRTLMPGLIDAHWHTMMASLPLLALMTSDVGFIHLAAAAEAERTLMRGFTTVRDLGGPSFALKKAIDSGMITGPRIYPCGAIISQTSGHGDFRFVYETPRTDASPLSRSEVLGAAAVADGPDEVRRRVREQLMAGATQIKLAAGGGVASTFDPLDVIQYRPEEIRAAVEAAADWGTYVSAHVYMAEGIKRCIRAGVMSIEHGQLADEESIQMMADRDVIWSAQPFIKSLNANIDNLGEGTIAKWNLVWDGTDRGYELAIKHKLIPAFGTDVLFNPKAAALQATNLAAMTRWYTPAQALQMATSVNAAVCARSGARNPYSGKLGVIEKGALADILVVDGDPLMDLTLVVNAERNFKIIMKGGVIHKNTL